MSGERPSLYRALDRIHALRGAIVSALAESDSAAVRERLERALQVDDSAAFFEPGYAYDPNYAESMLAQQDFLAQLDPEEDFPVPDGADASQLRLARDLDYLGVIRKAQERIEDLERRRDAVGSSGEEPAVPDELGWYLASVRGEDLPTGTRFAERQDGPSTDPKPSPPATAPTSKLSAGALVPAMHEGLRSTTLSPALRELEAALDNDIGSR